MNKDSVIERQAVRAILITPDSEVLLMRIRLPQVDEIFWLAPGGGLETGESREGALRRELMEEIGLEHFTLGPLVWRRQHTFEWAGQRIRQLEHYYVVRANRFEPRMSDAKEMMVLDRFRWWGATDLACAQERLTPLSLADIVTRYLTHGPPTEPPDLEVVAD